MKRNQQIALLTAAMLLLGAAGCGTKEDPQMQSNASRSEWSMADPSLNLPTLNLGSTTEDMIRRAVINEGNTARLADAMKRAKAGEQITIGTIGGSITQGTAASTTDERYANRALEWWTKAFPQAQLDFVNAGIGATDSYIGVHRVDADLLSKKPDVVIVEFSVNDTDAALNLQTYDSLVRLVSFLADYYGLDREEIIRHYDVTGKLCPLYYVEHEDAWEAFRDAVQSSRKSGLAKLFS